MIDQIKVTRSNQTSVDAVWDDSAGCWVPKINTPQEIFSGEACVSAKGWTPQQQLDAGIEMTVSAFKINTKIGTPPFLKEDFVQVLSSVRSETLVGKVFIVEAPIYSTYEIQQQVFAQIWDPSRPR